MASIRWHMISLNIIVLPQKNSKTHFFERKNSQLIKLFQILLIYYSVTPPQAPICMTGIRHQKFLIFKLLRVISELCNPKCVLKEDNINIPNEFEFQPNSTKDCGVSCP